MGGGFPEEMALLAEGASRLGVFVGPEQIRLLDAFLAELVKWNERVNLTGFRSPRDMVVGNFIDSIAGLALVGPGFSGKAADVGSGAGFPGLPLRIVRPAIEMVLIEPRQKRAAFLEHVVLSLGLRGVSVVPAGAELVAREGKLREGFDLAMARGVGALEHLFELALPLVRVGGRFIAWRGAEGAREAREAGAFAGSLGGEVCGVTAVELPFSGVGRSLVEVRKVAPTPGAFPRARAARRKRTPG